MKQLAEVLESLRRATLEEEAADVNHQDAVVHLKRAAERMKTATDNKTAAQQRVNAIIQNLSHSAAPLVAPEETGQ